ncbi:MAG: hypothetical protein CL927_02700, partial [Deltaproteobacteria bacterium]|nr:hypothetical protein [Deltaproteobacteria bacterium]
MEQLCRYIARPPLAKERVEALPGGRVRIGLKRAWSDGTTALELSRLELVGAAAIPIAAVGTCTPSGGARHGGWCH